MAVIIAKKQDIIDIADIVREKSGLTEKMSFKGIYDAINEYMPEQPKSYLTFSSPSAFSISVSTPGWNGTMEYSTDKTNWIEWDGSEISGVSTDNNYAVYLRGTGNTKVTGTSSSYTSTGSSYAWTLNSTNDSTEIAISCIGNIENLLDYATVSSGEHPKMAAHCYAYMFYGCTSLVQAPELPATTLASYCYRFMFSGCTSLVQAPELPATTLASWCYHYMFSNCKSLTTTPELPAITLADYCYRCMFYNCTSLTTAPAELPATVLTTYCYAQMFTSCTNLVKTPILPATNLAAYCYYAMFQNCSNLVETSALPATTLASSCYDSMFRSCKSLTQVPELPATTLTQRCYYYMFTSCTSIKLSSTQTDDYTQAYRIPTSGTGTTATNALYDMFGSTGGTFTGTSTINTTYYLHKDCTIV